MFSVIKSDFYKLIMRKSFYICGSISGIIGIFLVCFARALVNPGIEGFNGINSIDIGLVPTALLSAIFLSMFVSSEFAYGTIKNIVSRGISRVSIYTSKLIMGVFTSVTYVLFSMFCGFVAGSIAWGIGEFKGDEFLDKLKVIGLFLIAEICLQSVFIMVGFLVRHTGETIAINLGVYLTAEEILLKIADYLLQKINLIDSTIASKDYWVGSYIQIFLDEASPARNPAAQDVINRGLLVCLAYLVVSTAIGIITFFQRDIK